MGWTIKAWATAVQEAASLDFDSQPGMRMLLKDVLMALAENPSLASSQAQQQTAPVLTLLPDPGFLVGKRVQVISFLWVF